MDAKEFIFQKYLDWQKQSGRSQAQGKFAAYLGVSASSLSDWLNGAYAPSGAKNISALAEKLGPEVYDVLGLARPAAARGDETDEKISEITQHLSDEDKREVLAYVESLIRKGAAARAETPTGAPGQKLKPSLK